MISQNFMFMSGWLDSIEEMPPQIQYECVMALLRYGVHELEPPEDINPWAKSLLKTIIPSIDKGHDNYLKKGGRPAAYDKETYYHYFRLGWSNQEIANELGMSVRTVQNYKQKWVMEEQDVDKDYDNDKDYDKYKDKDKGISAVFAGSLIEKDESLTGNNVGNNEIIVSAPYSIVDFDTGEIIN